MLDEMLTSLTEKYHETGHIDPAIDHMMDMGGGFGHRVEFGHDLDGFLRAYELDGFNGAHGWIDHIAKDFTSPAGIPLPFAKALVHLTPLDYNDAVHWLSVNAADFLELGAEGVVVEVIERRFSENRTAYHVALAAGLALGFFDDNPLLIAFSGGKWLINAKRNLAAFNPQLSDRVDRSISRLSNTFERASYYALGGDEVAHLLHVADLAPLLEHATDGIPILGDLASIGNGVAATFDGLATFGLVFVARRAVKSLFGNIHGTKQREAARLASRVRPRMVLVGMLRNGVAPEALVGTVTEMNALTALPGRA